jgi:hypothetical protein
MTSEFWKNQQQQQQQQQQQEKDALHQLVANYQSLYKDKDDNELQGITSFIHLNDSS